MTVAVALLIAVLVLLAVLAFVAHVGYELARAWLVTDAGRQWIERHRGKAGSRRDGP